MAPAMRALLLALFCSQAFGMTMLKPKKKTRTVTRALVTTMVYPDDEIPVDLMMEHHLRTVSSNMSILQGAIIDNRPPWGSEVSNHEPLLRRYRRSENTTGVVRVKSVDYSRLSELMQKFFSSDQINFNSKTVRLAKDVPSNISKLDEKAKAAHLLGMLHFLELCNDADADVDLCIYMDSTTFVHRSNNTGVVEQAVKLFRQNPNAVVLMPPDMCLHMKATEHGVCKVANATGSINHGFFVLNRDRFEGFAPMPVESVDLSSSFEELLAEGLTKGGVEGPVKQIRCGGAFVIHPYDGSLGKYACRSGGQMGLSAHSQLLASRHSQGPAASLFASDYQHFPGGVDRAGALKLLIERFEAGKFPEAHYLDSMTNKCNNMCVSRDRVREGLAW